jgi:hypothetical protein
MKKLFVLIILLTGTVSVYAQDSGPKIAANQIIIESNAVISESDEDNDGYYIMAGLPLGNNLSSVTIYIRSVVNRYSDLSFEEPWVKIEEGLYRCTLYAIDEYLFIYYSEGNNMLGFFWLK